MKEGLVRIDEVGRLVIPKEARKVLKLSDSKLVQIYIERDKIVLKKYQPILDEIALAAKICNSLANLTNAICLVCDNEKVLCVSSELLSGLNLKKLSMEFLNAMQGEMPLLLNAQENSLLFDLVKAYDFKYYSLCSVTLNSEEKVGYLLLVSVDEKNKFSNETLDFLTLSKNLIEGVL